MIRSVGIWDHLRGSDILHGLKAVASTTGWPACRSRPFRFQPVLIIKQFDGDRHYLTAFNGEMWKGGFDLPFLRTACVRNDVVWPFPDIAYADMFDIVDRFNTDDVRDLVGVYNQLIGGETCDPFEESGEAVDAFENGDWEAIELTANLVGTVEEFVTKVEWKEKTQLKNRMRKEVTGELYRSEIDISGDERRELTNRVIELARNHYQ